MYNVNSVMKLKMFDIHEGFMLVLNIIIGRVCLYTASQCMEMYFTVKSTINIYNKYYNKYF